MTRSKCCSADRGRGRVPRTDRLAEGGDIASALRDATRRELNRVPVRPDDLVGLNPPVASGVPPLPPDVLGPQAGPRASCHCRERFDEVLALAVENAVSGFPRSSPSQA